MSENSEWTVGGGGHSSEYGDYTIYKSANMRVDVPDEIIVGVRRELKKAIDSGMDEMIKDLGKVGGGGFITTDMSQFAVIAIRDLKRQLEAL